MEEFIEFLEDIKANAQIEFNISLEQGKIIYNSIPCFNHLNIINFYIRLGKATGIVSINEKDKVCIPLLKYTIENKYKELFTIKQQLLKNILAEKEAGINKINENLPCIKRGCTIIVVRLEDNLDEAVNVIDELYANQNTVSTIYGDNIVILGCFEEIIEHVKSIKEAIANHLYCKCLITYETNIFGVGELIKAYKDANENLILGKRFEVNEYILDYNKVLFEKIVYNVKPDVKKEIINRFSKKFNEFDKEMILSVEQFLSCGLNISDAAKKLYIHRNTLIYRLDKIRKETGFDIRNFKEAANFFTAFLIWKEQNTSKPL